MSERSIVTLLGCLDRGKCRYCKELCERKNWVCMNSKIFCSMVGEGTLLYKPLNAINCCPCYPIRCEATKFRPSRSQRKVLQDVVDYLNTGCQRNVDAIAQARQKEPEFEEIFQLYTSMEMDPCIKGNHLEKKRHAYFKSYDSGIFLEDDAQSLTSESKKADYKINTRNNSSKQKRWAALQDGMRQRGLREGIPYEKLMEAYLLRRQNRLQKNMPKGIEYYDSQTLPKEQAAHFIETRLMPVTANTPELEKILLTEFKVYEKYSNIVHGATSSDTDFDDFVTKHVDSPLRPRATGLGKDSNLPEFGSFHQQYWLDGKTLIAVGVVDILPSYLSSSYFFYDPDYEFLRLGTYSAMREIAFLRNLYHQYGPQSQNPSPALASFKNYTMGFYIHSSSKMNYKAQYYPSELACPETNTWHPIDSCRKFLEVNPYCRFGSPLCTDLDGLNIPAESIKRRVQFLFLRGKSKAGADAEDVVMPVGDLKPFASDHFINMVVEWAHAVGKLSLDGQILLNFVW